MGLHRDILQRKAMQPRSKQLLTSVSSEVKGFISVAKDETTRASFVHCSYRAKHMCIGGEGKKIAKHRIDQRALLLYHLLLYTQIYSMQL